MLQFSCLATGRSLFGRCPAAVTASRHPEPASAAIPHPPASTRSRTLLLRTAALLLLAAGFAMPALAQTVSFTGISPTSFSAAGQTITFSLSFGNSNAVTRSIAFPSVGMNYPTSNVSCVGLPATPNETVTCTFQYTTRAADVGNPIIQYGSFVATDPNGTTRSGSISNQQIVPYVVPQAVPAASISVAPASVSEDGATNLVYTVTLSQARSSATTVNLSTGGTASGTDYSGAVAAVNIAAGATTATVTINPTADATVEANETVTLGIANGTGYTVGAPASATGTILNDDAPSLSINDVSVTEGNAGTSNATFTVSLSQPAGPGGVSFDIATANGTASAGVDYVTRSLVGQTIPAGSSTYSFTVQVNGDTLSEPNETFFVNLSNIMGATATDAQGVGTIANDDAVPSLSIAGASVTEGNSGNVSAVFTVTLSAASGQSVSVNYATANGSATAGSDYVAASGTLTFTPGQTSRTLAVSVNGDTTVESDETFSVGLSGATNATLATAAGTGTILNDDVEVVVNPTSLPNANFAVAYSQTLSASGGAAPYAFAVTAGALPTGLSLSSAGALSGTPTAPGAFNFTITATDANSVSGSRAYAGVVGAPTITLVPVTLPNGTVAVAYSQSASAAGGTAPYSYAITAGALPAGLSLGSAGGLSGTPTAGGTFNFTITATDSSSGPYAGSRAYTLTVAAPSLVLTPAAGTLTANYNVAYSLNASASGGTGPYSYSLASGSLPVGVSFTSAGLLSGTPTVPGSYPLAIRAADSSTGTGAPYSITNNYTLEVAAPTIAIDPATLPDGAAGTAYNTILSASGGLAPYNYSLLSGALPIGMSFSSAGQFSGTPRSDGNFSLTVRATDANGQTGSRVFNFNIAAPILAITPATLPAGTTNIAYSQALSTTGGIAPYSYSIVSGNLPIGVSFSSAGVISGMPTTAGSYTAAIRSTDDMGYNTTISSTIVIDAPSIVIDPATLPDGNVGTAYNAALSASGGAAPYSYSLMSGALPIGMTFNSAGQFSGIPRSDGSFSLTMRATDANGNAGTQSYTFSIAAPTLAITPATLPAGTTNIAYSQSLATSGGIAPYSYSVVSGSLPIGVSFSSAGVFSGTPTTAGNYTATVRSTDDAGYTVDAIYTIAIDAPTIVIDPATLDAAVVGNAYVATLTANGGAAPYAFALETGALPSGISLGGAGGLSGTPSASGTFNFDVRATDSNGNSGTRAYALVVAARTLVLGPAILVNGAAGSAYSQSVEASGGIAPYSYALSSGALPAGLAFANGVLSGTPTASGSFTFDITASDSGGGTPATTTRSYTLVIAAPVITITPGALPNGVRGSVYSQALSASSGTAAYAFTLGGGALPAGISLAGDGTLAGTPTADGSFNFTVIATDALGFTGSATYAWVVARAAPAVVDDVATTLGGTAVSIAVTDNDTGSIDSIVISTVPAHGSVTIEGLAISYTPEAGFTGTDSFRYTATGPGGTSAAATVTVTVNPLPVAVSRKLTANAGVAVEVDLTEGASGGPFTEATIVSLSPANAGTANVAQVGSGDAARYVLTYTPAATFSGLATVRFTLGNAYATSAEATIEFDVTARPDPSQDPEVRALLAAQAASTRRFATAQINNFQQRLESMHGDGDSRFSNQVSFSVDSDRDCEDQVGRIPGRRCEHQARNDEVAHAAAAPADIGNSEGAVFGTWIGGVIRSGNHDGRGGSAGIDFESDGLSVGADYRLNGKFAFGGGLGWGRDDSDVGDHGSRSEGKAYTAALYASYHPGERLFVDGLMGYQDLSYDLRRYVTSNGALVQGARDGTQWFASLSAGADIRHGEHLQLTPYARLDLARATLDDYTEHGDPLYSLRYADMDVDTTIGNLGLRIDYRRERSWGLFSPQLRLEYQHDFQGNGDATMGYADQLSGPFYRTGLEAFDRNRFVIGIGAQFSTDSGLSTRIEYRGVVGDGDDSDHGLLLNIEKRY